MPTDVPEEPRERRTCPECGGRLGAPVSGDVHCYVECTRCGSRFDLNDPRVEPTDPAAG